MKVKYIIVYAALAAAFGAVSLWVFLSGGRSAKVVRAKFRLGGLLLSVSSMLSLASCNGAGGIFQPTCYDVAAPENVYFTNRTSGEKLKPGDVVAMSLNDGADGFDSFSYEMMELKEDKVFQSGELVFVDGLTSVTIEETEYRGDFLIRVYGHSEGMDPALVAELYLILE